MALSNRSGTHAPLPVLLRNNLLVAAFIFALLELWLPCFFLTDDNLSAGYPVYTEIGLRLLHGHSPFVSQWLFGGNYDLHTDPMFFNWHPVYLLVSLLAGTPAHFFMIDAAAFVFFLLAAAGFTYLAHILREELALELSDGWLMFYTLSYTYSFLMIATGASWLSFLGNHSALPWLAAGILQKTWRRGLGLVTLFSLHHILGGHLAPFISSTIFLTLFAGGVAIWRRSLLPLVSWGAGLGLALLVALPLLLPVFQGFLGSHRADGLTVEGMQNSRVPLFVAPGSYLVGTALWLVKHPSDFHVYHPALAACAAAWCLFPALLGRSHWRFLPALCLGLVILVSILVIRPVWLSQAIIQVPVLRALRMPFRELLIFEFFLHLFLVTRPPAFSETVRRAVGGWSLAVFLIPMLLYAPPSFNPMKQERRLLFSGEFDAYWQQVHTHLRPRIAWRW